MVIYLVRHGKDDDNYRGGWSNRGLVQEGINQSRKLAKYLYDNKDKYNINTLISSDLRRATQTANEISLKLNIPLKLDTEWREINNGALSGMLNTKANKKYPNLFFNTLQMDEPYPDGESPIDFYLRIKNAYLKLCNDVINEKIGPNIMIVTHGGVINILYYIINGLDWTNKSPTLCKISSTSIHTIKYISEKWQILNSNSINYLKVDK